MLFRRDITALAVGAIVNAVNTSWLGAAHIKAGALIADRLLTPVETGQALTQASTLPTARSAAPVATAQE